MALKTASCCKFLRQAVSLSDVKFTRLFYYYYYYNHYMAPWTVAGTIWVSSYHKGKTNLDLLEQEIVSGSGISWAICKSAPHPSTPPLGFLQTRCPSCHPTNSVKALKAHTPLFCVSSKKISTKNKQLGIWTTMQFPFTLTWRNVQHTQLVQNLCSTPWPTAVLLLFHTMNIQCYACHD